MKYLYKLTRPVLSYMHRSLDAFRSNFAGCAPWSIFAGCAPWWVKSRGRGHAVWTLVSATCLLPRVTSSFRGVQRAFNRFDNDVISKRVIIMFLVQYSFR